MEVPRGIRFSRGWELRGRRILEGGKQRQVRRGVPEGGQARSMEVVLKVGGLNLGVLGGSPGLGPHCHQHHQKDSTEPTIFAQWATLVLIPHDNPQDGCEFFTCLMLC